MDISQEKQPVAAIPSLFYIFVDFANPLTVHNITFTRTFTSAAYTQASFDTSFRNKYMNNTVDYLPFLPNDGDLKVFSPFCLNVIYNYRAEMDAEVVRKQYYPTAPSRLSAIYAFGDYETCQIVHEKYKWPLEQVRQFRLQQDSLSKVLKVNMEIMSLARRAYAVSSLDASTVEHIWKHYWSGGEDLSIELPTNKFARAIYPSGIIWEYLVEGKLVLDDVSAQ